MWRFTAPPIELSGIIFTAGYSIENDLYAGSSIESLLDQAEKTQHIALLAVLCRWFAFEVSEHLLGRSAHCAKHINQVVDLNTFDLLPIFVAQRNFVEPDPGLIRQIYSSYQMQLRGKSLLELLMQFLSNSARNPKYSRASVVDMCLKLYPNNPHIKRIISEAKGCLA